MFTYETADQKEVRRFRIAQFNGRAASVRAGETVVTGMVRSVQENSSSVPTRWVITLIPAPAKAKAVVLRPGPRFEGFSEDYL
ncbi:MAG: hypothetical protein JOZ74_11475 [Bradyrhizobium sp.]|nr:hypothetical protein [Bradyrhizobium sp.]